MPTDAKPETALEAPKKKKKKQSAAAMQRELRDLAKPSPDAPEKPPVDMKKLFVRVGRRRGGGLGPRGDRHPLDASSRWPSRAR